MRPIRARTLFPWVSPQASRNQVLSDDMLFDDNVVDDPQLGFCGMLGVTGMLHVIHSAGESILTATPDLQDAMEPLKEICKIVTHQSSCQRLCETCFAGPVSRTFVKDLRRFRALVYEKRWGTVAFGTKAILELQVCLWNFWSLSLYTGQQERVADDNQGSGPQLLKANSGITSRFWWAKIMTWDALYSLIRQALTWTESCPCHWHLDFKKVCAKVRQKWERCPMRHLRVPEVAAGDFFRMFTSFCEKTIGELYVRLPDELTAAQRSVCIKSFESGRAAVLFVFVLKVTPFTIPPLLIFGIAHHTHHKAVAALRTCLASTDDHPQIQELQSLQDQAEAFIEGAAPSDVPEFTEFRARYRFAFLGERQVESPHAIVNIKTSNKRSRAEAFDSIVLRTTDITRHLENNYERFVGCLSDARSPKKLVTALGLDHHPGIHQKALHSWKPIFRKVIYHADPWSLYRIPLPEMHMGMPPPPPKDGDRKEDVIAAVKDDDTILALLPVQQPEPRRIAVDATFTDCLISSLQKEALLAHVVELLAQTSASSLLFSCTASHSAVHSVQRLFTLCVPSGSENSSDIDKFLQLLQQGVEATSTLTAGLWFSVVSGNASRRKRALKGHVTSNDIGVALHRVLQCDPSSRSVTVSMTPVNIQGVIADIVPMHGVALMMSLGELSFTELSSLRKWACDDELVWSLNNDYDGMARRLLQRLMDNRRGVVLPDDIDGVCDPDDGEQMAQVLQRWSEKGFVSSSPVQGGALKWNLTEPAQQSLVAGARLSNPIKLASVCGVPHAEMNKWQLMNALANDGWSPKVVTSKQMLQLAKDRPYDINKDGKPPVKEWFIHPKVQHIKGID